MEQMLCLSVENIYPGRNALSLCPGPKRGLLRLRRMRPDPSSRKPVTERGRVGLAGSLWPRTHTRTQPEHRPAGTAQQQPFPSLIPCPTALFATITMVAIMMVVVVVMTMVVVMMVVIMMVVVVVIMLVMVVIMMMVMVV